MEGRSLIGMNDFRRSKSTTMIVYHGSCLCSCRRLCGDQFHSSRESIDDNSLPSLVSDAILSRWRTSNGLYKAQVNRWALIWSRIRLITWHAGHSPMNSDIMRSVISLSSGRWCASRSRRLQMFNLRVMEHETNQSPYPASIASIVTPYQWMLHWFM